MNSIIATKDYDNSVLILEMNERINSFTEELLSTLEMWLDEAVVDTQLKSIIIMGRESIFSVGGDFKKMKEELDKGTPEAYMEKIVPKINSIIKKIATHPLIIVAAINGSAAGGGLSLALSCDYTIAVPDAKFAFAFSSVNLTPDSGSIISFLRSFGYSKSLSALLKSEVMTAKEAYDLGAINHLSEPNKLRKDAIQFAKSIQSVNRDIISVTKSLLNSSLIDTIDNKLKIEFDEILKASKMVSYAERLNILVENLRSNNK
jgi:2-(1,2-epoxy-1,2-dihydrophenyl)acetyl-CoA isomerase